MIDACVGGVQALTDCRHCHADEASRLIQRRTSLFGLGVLLAGIPVTATAQTRRARVGLLSLYAVPTSGARTPYQLLLLDLLQQKGWSEAANLVFEVRGAAPGKSLGAAAAELVALRPDVLVSAGTPAISALRDHTAEIPIVMAGAGDPVGTGLVASLARPGGNITGVSWQLQELIPKVLSLLREIAPRAQRVDFLIQANDPGRPFFARVMVDAAHASGLATQVVELSDVDSLVAAIAASPADAILLLASGMIYPSLPRIAAAAVQRRLPLVITGGPGRDPTAAGFLFCYSANGDDTLRRTADYVDRILRGAKPSVMPVEQPLRYDFVINMKTARAIGLTVPRSLLLRADETFE